MPPDLLEELDPGLNEFYLWHGSSVAAIGAISEDGFDMSVSGKGLFGRGIYFAECSSKADEYASPDRKGEYEGMCAMILCRVVLGRPHTLLRGDPDAIAAALAISRGTAPPSSSVTYATASAAAASAAAMTFLTRAADAGDETGAAPATDAAAGARSSSLPPL